MIQLDRNIYMFRRKEVWLSDYPFDIKGCHFVSFYACKNFVSDTKFAFKKVNTLIIDLTQDLDVIWSNMEKKSCQYPIKRALRENIQIKLNDHYEEYYHLNMDFKKQKGLRPYSMDNAESIRNNTLFTAELNGEVVAGQSYIEDESNIRWILGASKRLNVDKDKAILIGCANRLMNWEAIKYAKQKGIIEFDMGGYYTGDDQTDSKFSVNIYKKSFGGKLVDRYNYTKSYSSTYDFVLKLRSILLQLRK